MYIHQLSSPSKEFLLKFPCHLEEGKLPSGWITCGHGMLMPPQNVIVPIAVRTLRGHFLTSGFWFSSEYTDEWIRKNWDKEEVMQKYLTSIVWSEPSLRKIVGVLAWYKVPDYNEDIAVKLQLHYEANRNNSNSQQERKENLL